MHIITFLLLTGLMLPSIPGKSLSVYVLFSFQNKVTTLIIIVGESLTSLSVVALAGELVFATETLQMYAAHFLSSVVHLLHISTKNSYMPIALT